MIRSGNKRCRALNKKALNNINIDDDTYDPIFVDIGYTD
jgi:hypothetical protein